MDGRRLQPGTGNSGSFHGALEGDDKSDYDHHDHEYRPCIVEWVRLSELMIDSQTRHLLNSLFTLPIRPLQAVLGKYLAALALVSVAVLGTLTYPITFAVLGITGTGPPAVVAMFSQTGLDWGATLCGYGGLLLMGAAVCAIGTAASSLTSSQIIAFLVALLVSLFPYVTGFFLERFPPELLPWAQGIAFDYHFDNLARGVVDTRDVVFFGSVVALALHVAVHSLERMRLT